ncbi:hypothetical protein AVEN_241786-1 [Araneus ventricosus]|uniref:Uncharacterized protein n=1 Tax=Araneus ventricosus TaxID=182803 RepID=A0A4Y2P1Y0_ARAVE|nr:hypothetical protein AVEN_241786-1 [Araneus ventricosus]
MPQACPLLKAAAWAQRATAEQNLLHRFDAISIYRREYWKIVTFPHRCFALRCVKVFRTLVRPLFPNKPSAYDDTNNCFRLSELEELFAEHRSALGTDGIVKRANKGGLSFSIKIRRCEFPTHVYF